MKDENLLDVLWKAIHEEYGEEVSDAPFEAEDQDEKEEAEGEALQDTLLKSSNSQYKDENPLLFASKLGMTFDTRESSCGERDSDAALPWSDSCADYRFSPSNPFPPTRSGVPDREAEEDDAEEDDREDGEDGEGAGPVDEVEEAELMQHMSNLQDGGDVSEETTEQDADNVEEMKLRVACVGQLRIQHVHGAATMELANPEWLLEHIAEEVTRTKVKEYLDRVTNIVQQGDRFPSRPT